MPRAGRQHSITIITNAQILALPTTHVQILAAPGAGFRIHVYDVFLDINTAAGAYTNIATDDQSNISLALNGNGVGHFIFNDSVASQTNLSDFIGGASRKFFYLGNSYEDAVIDWGVYDYAQDTATLENQPLQLICGNSLGNFTGGNAANTMRVTVGYGIVPTV